MRRLRWIKQNVLVELISPVSFMFFLWLLENLKGLEWLTIYFHWTDVLSDPKKVPNLTTI